MRKVLIQAANAAKQKKGAFFRSKYNKLKFRLGSANKAKVAIANRLARVIFKVLAGDQFKDIGYIRASDHEEKIKKLVNQLKALGVDIRHQGHQKIVSTRNAVVSNSGVILS